MTKTQAIELAGSAAALAKLLGVTQSAVTQWDEQIPDGRVWQLRAIRPKWFRQLKGKPEIVAPESQPSNEVSTEA